MISARQRPAPNGVRALTGLCGLALVVACSKSTDPPAAVVPDGCDHAEEAPMPAPSRFVARWAFTPWISKDISTRADTYAFVDGFRERDIPVGAVVLDSPWETHYNTFQPNPSRYPDFPGMVADMHARGVRVVLWTTQMVNTSGLDLEPGGDRYDGPAPLYEEGERCGYYLNGGQSFFWWKGFGSAVDFFHPRARTWWHKQQDTVLDAGIDGWKLDFGESYVRTAKVQSFAGEKPHQEYSEKYYEDFLQYGRKKRGEEFLTMVRAWDASYEHAGRFFARKEHAPVSWMGDNRRDFIGLADALDHMFISAQAGYVVLGSDLGGYLDKDDLNLTGADIPFDPVNFAIWTAVSAMTPFMQLHGRGNFTPWTVPVRAEEITANYRYWAKLHQALVPFFFDATSAALAGGAPMIEPLGAKEAWPNDYRYHLGGAFLVAPVLDATGVRAVPLPAGAKYYGFFDHVARDGGTVVPANPSSVFGRIPLFVREGAIIPLDVTDATNELGDVGSKGALTLLAYPAQGLSRFTHIEDDGSKVELSTSATSARSVLGVDGCKRPVRARVRSEIAPTRVTLDGAATTLAATQGEFLGLAEGAFYDTGSRSVWVRAGAGRKEIALER